MIGGQPEFSADDRFLAPLDGEAAPCGIDLDASGELAALDRLVQGRPETQFSAAVPPDWRAVQALAEQLLERSRDLRVMLVLARAGLQLQGFAALSQGLGRVRSLLERYWDTLHPLPEDGDFWHRQNALAVLRDPAFFAELRQARLCSVRGVGELRVRAVEVALGLVPPRQGEAVTTREQLSGMLADAAREDPSFAAQPAAALREVEAIAAVVAGRIGAEAAQELAPLKALLQGLVSLMPSAPVIPIHQDVAPPAVAQDPVAVSLPSSPPGTFSVRSREDAVRAIDMVCEFLERTEPTNPAPLLLRRARRMVNRNFLQLMKELAPDALPGVAGLMGIDPESVQID